MFFPQRPRRLSRGQERQPRDKVFTCIYIFFACMWEIRQSKVNMFSPACLRSSAPPPTTASAPSASPTTQTWCDYTLNPHINVSKIQTNYFFEKICVPPGHDAGGQPRAPPHYRRGIRPLRRDGPGEGGGHHGLRAGVISKKKCKCLFPTFFMLRIIYTRVPRTLAGWPVRRGR